VFRQLRQDVKAFWMFLDSQVAGVPAADRHASRDRLGAKMVGRWRDGSPVVKAPLKSDPTLSDDNDFGYFCEDKWGTRCPVASHIRRSNPRDCIDPDAVNRDVARVSVDGHRIIRRGRPYGPPVAPSMEPADMIAAPDPTEPSGLQFICFNADISRQFEFIQQTWIVSPKFGGLYSSSDPIAGDANPVAVRRGLFGDFVMPEEGFRDRRQGLQRFVHVEGGAYFFMPGINAVRYLSKLT
jgi:deferrochelatase/peroxidase EfeB